MSKKDSGDFFKPRILMSVIRFEEMLKNNEQHYFDIYNFEEILDYYVHKEQFSKAMRAANFAIRQHPYNSDFLLQKVNILINLGSYKKALTLLKKTEELGCDLLELNLHRGDTYMFLSNYAQAIQSYHTALALTDNSDQKEEIFLNLSFVYQCCQKYEKAKKYILLCLKQNPDNKEALSELSLYISFLDKYEEGIKYFNKIIDKSPYSYMAWFYLGTAYNHQGLFEKALIAFEYAFLIKEDFGLAYHEYANTLCKLEKYKEAIEYYKKESELTGEKVDTFKNIGLCYKKLTSMNLARNYYKRAMKYCFIEDSNDELWYLTGKTYACENKFHQAKLCYEKAIAINNEKSNYYRSLGDVVSKLENPDAAIQAYKKAINLEPAKEKNWINFSYFLFIEGNTNEAISLLENVDNKTNLSSEIPYLLSGYLLSAGKTKQALLILEKALSLDFDGHKKLFKSFPELEYNQQVLKTIEEYKI